MTRRLLLSFTLLASLPLSGGPVLAQALYATPGAEAYVASAQADPIITHSSAARGSGSGLGGGFIEFLVTGNSGGRATAIDGPARMRQPHSYRTPGRELIIDEADGGLGRPAVNRPRTAALSAPEARPSIAAVVDPIYRRQEVAYNGKHPPGTIIVDTPNRFLFLVQPGGRALRYGIGVGRPGFTWSGVKSVTMKREWPDWRPPPQMLKRRPDLPRHMTGGPDNPLGARALYLGSSLYRIHGTNEPNTIGTNVSSGCIRMTNQDVIDLYNRVRVGTRVVVI
jgi:lipoprotein-anchoring transpeptidase ErfK/SrfK